MGDADEDFDKRPLRPQADAGFGEPKGGGVYFVEGRVKATGGVNEVSRADCLATVQGGVSPEPPRPPGRLPADQAARGLFCRRYPEGHGRGFVAHFLPAGWV